jgi:hypothetical protein
MGLLKKLFGIKSISEAVFVIILALATVAVILINYWQHHQRYHHFYFESSAKEEFFTEKMKSGTLLLHKYPDKRSGYPKIHYKVILNSGEVSEASMVLGEFELFPDEVIFQEHNGSIAYVDQYAKPDRNSTLNTLP